MIEFNDKMYFYGWYRDSNTYAFPNDRLNHS